MHELSIADAILAVARAHAGERRLVAVEVEVGHLRQVVPAALAFAFELLAPGVALELTEVPAAGRCRACGAESLLAGFPLTCGECGGIDVAVVRGEELSVLSVEVDMDDVTAPKANGEAGSPGGRNPVTSGKGER
jgi:hydrogenase nickel incorporation protein HypA/HybF